MGMSLAFHIIFATVGIGMPVLMAIAEGLHLRTGKAVYLELAHRWARGTAILFAVGAVSGTVLSFELGLLWPTFMELSGAVIGMPFSLEGFAFFTEAIFLGVFLYGWNRIPPVAHWCAGIVVALSGIFSGIFVVCANAWMNTPVGFDFANGEFRNIQPIRAMLNPAAFHEVIHMTLAAFAATGFVVASIHAFFLRRDRSNEFHRAAFSIAAALGCVAIPLQIVSGDIAARAVAKLQPAKLAAMEAHFQTERGAPLIIGGIVNNREGSVKYALKIPKGLSLLLAHRTDLEVPGLDRIPRDQWPNVALVHLSFDVMVGCGMLMLLVAVWAGFVRWRKRAVFDNRFLLGAFVLAGPAGFIAIEAGWMVTELGRQPWTIYGILRTAEVVTPMPRLVIPFSIFTAVYLFLSVILVFLLKRQFLQTAPRETPKPHAP
jgi:cytochrome d ubiquinol oxidase subunit I